MIVVEESAFEKFLGDLSLGALSEYILGEKLPKMLEIWLKPLYLRFLTVYLLFWSIELYGKKEAWGCGCLLVSNLFW